MVRTVCELAVQMEDIHVCGHMMGSEEHAKKRGGGGENERL